MAGLQLRSPATTTAAGGISVGVTNIDAASHGDDIATAIAALPSGGGRVWLNKASYVLAAGISTSQDNLELIGAGGTGWDNQAGNGATQIIVPAGVVGFTFNPTGAAETYKAPTLRRLQFRDATPGSALGGVLIRAANGSVLEDIGCSNFTAGYGIKTDNASAICEYFTFTRPRMSRCKQGIIAHGNGHEIFGGYIDAQGNSAAAVVAGSTGVQVLAGSDTLRVFGTRVQYHAIAFDLQGGAQHELHGVRCEGFTTGINVGGTTGFSQCIGGSFDNSIIGNSGTAFVIGASATDFKLLLSVQVQCTLLSNAGARTVWQLGAARVQTLTDAATVTPDASAWDAGKLSSLSQASTIANPTGSPYDKQRLLLQVGSTVARALTWGAAYRAGSDIALPTTTTGGGKVDYFGFQWNSGSSTWDLIAQARGF